MKESNLHSWFRRPMYFLYTNSPGLEIWIRTTIAKFKALRPTFRRFPNIFVFLQVRMYGVEPYLPKSKLGILPSYSTLWLIHRFPLHEGDYIKVRDVRIELTDPIWKIDMLPLHQSRSDSVLPLDEPPPKRAWGIRTPISAWQAHKESNLIIGVWSAFCYLSIELI